VGRVSGVQNARGRAFCCAQTARRPLLTVHHIKEQNCVVRIGLKRGQWAPRLSEAPVTARGQRSALVPHACWRCFEQKFPKVKSRQICRGDWMMGCYRGCTT